MAGGLFSLGQSEAAAAQTLVAMGQFALSQRPPEDRSGEAIKEPSKNDQTVPI
jgi:hypothetical protein